MSVLSDLEMTKHLKTLYVLQQQLPNLETGCPGIGMDKVTPRASALGFICFIRAAAVSALGLPQSSKLKRLCLTGLLYDTLPLSNIVMFLTPQP